MASSVNLGEQLEAFVDRAVRAGRYGSRSEVLREGVRLVQEREAKWARFDSEIQKAIDSSDRGESIPLDEAFDELDDYIRRGTGPKTPREGRALARGSGRPQGRGSLDRGRQS